MNELPPRSWGINIYILTIYLSIIAKPSRTCITCLLLLLLLVLLLVSPSLGVQILTVAVQYVSSKQWGSYDSRLLALCELLALYTFEGLFNQSNMASQCSLELVHPCFVLFQIVDMVATEMVCSSTNGEQVGQSHEESR
jgi:hypothetical protein